MLNKKNYLSLIFCFTFVILVFFPITRADGTLTQFGNTDWNSEWNLAGGVVVASQFSIDQSIKVTMMSAYTKDVSPPSYCRLGILSDNNNAPYQCLCSTAVTQQQVTAGWQTIPLTSEITLQPGKYWLAQIDSGAGVIKYVEKPGSTLTISRNMQSSNAWIFFGPLDVGSTMPTDVQTVSGTLAIIASHGPPSFDGQHATYAKGAQCWTASSDSNPYPVQPAFPTHERVYIYWSPYNPSTGAVDIKIYSPGAIPSVSVPYCSFQAISPNTAPISFIPNTPGTWLLTCNGYSTSISVTPLDIFVLPEYPLGALLSLFAMFSGLVLFKNNRLRGKLRVRR
jgi:hypothetical protein